MNELIDQLFKIPYADNSHQMNSPPNEWFYMFSSDHGGELSYRDHFPLIQNQF